jgi:LysM repeat protein
MRISVLTGLFACAIVFNLSSVKADAASIDLLTINATAPAVEQLLAAADSADPELVISEVVPAPVIVNEYKIVENETLSDIAVKFNTTWQRIYDKNESIISPDIINPGEIVVIPTETEELTPRPLPEPVVVRLVKQAESTRPKAANSDPAPVSTSGNKYIAGYCTWYVKNRRPDMPNNLGNAISWVSRASAQGLATGSTPAVGAVGQQGNHVVYVESVNGDGTVTISDMNFKGWNVVTTRTVPASNFSYIY